MACRTLTLQLRYLPTSAILCTATTFSVASCGNAEPGSGAPQGGTASGGSDTTPGAGDDAGGASSVDPHASLLPWSIGNSWTYRVTKNGNVTEKTTTIGDLELVGGTGPNATLMAFHVTTSKGAG